MSLAYSRRSVAWVGAIALFAPAFVAVEGCASKGEGSETHFLCKADADCADAGPTLSCIDQQCVDPVKVCGGARPSYFCVDQCGSDFLATPVCRSGKWTCPAPMSMRSDECPPGTCFIPPVVTCCAPDGQSASPVCNDPHGEQPACGAGYFLRDSTQCDATCATGFTGAAPDHYAVTFRFTNESNAAIGLWHGCSYGWQVRTCADGFDQPVPTTQYCTPKCPETACASCGACYSEPWPVSPGKPFDDAWSGSFDILAGRTGACDCYDEKPALPGRYRVTVPVYPATSQNGMQPDKLYDVTVDFVLAGSSDVVVTIPLDRPDGGA